MRVIILDCNYICHAIYHSMPALHFHHKYTQIIFGFIKRTIALADKFKPNNIAFTWDSKQSIRRSVYPIYKQQRIKADNEATEEEKHNKRVAHLQFSDIRDTVLGELGFSNVHILPGYEADDLMASIVANNPEYKFIVVTTDQDMYQLISDNCHIYNPATRALRTPDTFFAEFGCQPDLWGKAKAIAGCKTDHVIGVPGVAEKTAIKYLLGELNPKSKKYKDIKAARNTIIENRELVILPIYGTPKIKLNGNNELTRYKFVKVCEKYGFESLLNKKNLERWDNVIC